MRRGRHQGQRDLVGLRRDLLPSRPQRSCMISNYCTYRSVQTYSFAIVMRTLGHHRRRRSDCPCAQLFRVSAHLLQYVLRAERGRALNAQPQRPERPVREQKLAAVGWDSKESTRRRRAPRPTLTRFAEYGSVHHLPPWLQRAHRRQSRPGVGLALTRQGGEVDGPHAQVPSRRGEGQVPRKGKMLCAPSR